MIDWSFPLTFIVRGDGYPCAGGEWSQLSVSIVNMGLWGRIPACVWVIGLAICGDKQMATLATLWKAIEVRFVHQQLFRRRSGNLFRRCSIHLFEVAGVEGEGFVGDGVVVGEGEGGVCSGAPCAPPTTQEE